MSVSSWKTRRASLAVLDGTANLGFVEGEIDEPALSIRAVAEDRLIAVVTAKHPWPYVQFIRGTPLLSGGDPSANASSAFQLAVDVVLHHRPGVDASSACSEAARLILMQPRRPKRPAGEGGAVVI